MEDMMNYRTLNIMKVNYLKHIFKEVNDNTLEFRENHFNKYCFETSEIFISICSLNRIKEEQLAGFTKKLFDSHLFQLIKELKKGNKFKVDFSTLEYIIEKFVLINFGSYISKQFIIESLIKDFDDNDFSSQFSSIKPYIKSITSSDILLDYSDSTSAEKLIYLYKSGVIDFLKDKYPFKNNVNRLATFLSAVTGERTDSLYPALNPMLKSNNAQKNNPLNTEKTVSKVQEKLLNLGFRKDDLLS